MMSFKQFLQSQDDNITDEEAIRKFNDYKLDFKRQQIHEFFLQHKDEEWWDLPGLLFFNFGACSDI